VTTAALFGFWLALVVMAYTYVGYPLLVTLLGWLRPAPVPRPAPVTPPLSLILVVRDEEAHIERKLESCLALDYPRERLEILVVSDGSTDRTEAIVRGFAERGVRLLALPRGRGKAAALNAAVPEARGEVLLFTDARQQLATDVARLLVAHFADPSIGAVSGELHLAPPAAPSASRGVGLYWSLEKRLRRAESRLDSTVGVTGAVYALRKDLFRPLDERTILDDVAVPMEVVLRGRRVLFEPAAAAWDTIASDPAREYKRKVRTLAGNFQLVRLRPALLDPTRNRLFWQLVSHKLLRLAVPWCLLALFASSLILATTAPAFRTVALLQVAFYLSALAAAALQRAGHAPRPLSVPYTFVMLNLAAAAAFFDFLRGRQTAAWRGAAR
jgi:poly-beta-1,6-N-acetyl-D-glucosamine synthase